MHFYIITVKVFFFIFNKLKVQSFKNGGSMGKLHINNTNVKAFVNLPMKPSSTAHLNTRGKNRNGPYEVAEVQAFSTDQAKKSHRTHHELPGHTMPTQAAFKNYSYAQETVHHS